MQEAVEILEVEILKFRKNIDRMTAEAIVRINKMQRLLKEIQQHKHEIARI